MKLTPDQLKGLVQCMGVTHERELNCNECLDLVSEYVEQSLSGKSISAALAMVEYHLELCPECRDEYEALRTLLTDSRTELELGNLG